MRELETTGQFRKDLKRERKSNPAVDGSLMPVVESLQLDNTLPAARRDHALTGSWKDHRECHVKPDLLLIYAKPDPQTLMLARLGSHSELFG